MASKSFVLKADIKFPSKAEIKQSGQPAKAAKKAFTVGSLRASGIVERQLPGVLTKALESPVWGPFNPSQPYFRKNGELVGVGNRDIIDTGNLHDSLKISTKFMVTKAQMQISYTAPYARLVHEGGVIQPWGNPNASSVILPARPWISSVLTGNGPVDKYDYTAVYQEEIAEAWG